MKTKNYRQVGVTVLSALGLLACGDPLKSAQIIEEPRTLAVQFEAEDGSARPGLGEEATARILFAGPEGPQEVQVAYRICEAADSVRGVPYCEGQIYAEGTLDGVDSLAEIAFSVPDNADEGTRLAVLGVACAKGEPTLAEDPNDWSCSGAETPLAFSFDGFLTGEERNDNPDFSELAIQVDGQSAEAEGVDQAPSCADGIPMVTKGKKTTVTIDYGALAREEGEWLQASHFATSGEYERQFTILEPDEELTTELEWKATEEGPAKHYLVVRDGFGGVGFATWSVCVE